MENKKDVLKIINDLAEIISVLLELKKRGKFKDALQKIDETLIAGFDFDSNYINSVSEDLLIRVVHNEKGFSCEEISALADLLNEQGDILLKQNNLRHSKKTLQNALKLYYFLNEDQDFFSFKNMNKMVLINDKLSKINLQIKS